MAHFEDLFITVPDGLRLHLRDYRAAAGTRLCALCLPGLTRNAADFDRIASALATDPLAPRRVIAMDLRGRGLSDHDPKQNYTVAVELADVLAVIAALELAPVLVIGSSRGGLIAMAMAAQHSAVMGGVVLNDIGPVIAREGLLRIKSYVGKLPQPASYEDGAAILRRLSVAQFSRLEAKDWLAAARANWREQNGKLVLNYDAALARTLDNVGPEEPIADMWPYFDALAGMPVLVIRGANSDILSPETVTAMRVHHADLEVYEVPDEGHTPLLADPETIARVGKIRIQVRHRPGVSFGRWSRPAAKSDRRERW